MRLTAAAPLTAFFAIIASAAYGALPLAHPGPTVNDYTAAEAQRAESAARSTGFGTLEITMVQDGNFFMDAQKQGEAYTLTVTRAGKVYPSNPSTIVSN